MRAGAIGATAALVAVLASGCGGASTPTPPPTPSRTTPTPSATASPTSSATTPSTPVELPPGFGAQRAASKTWPDPAGRLDRGVAVRVARHPGFDRVVYEFAGSGTPAFQVQYVQDPVADPSGLPVDGPGDAFLKVRVAGLGYPEASDPAPSPVPTADLAGFVVAQSGVLVGGFEGTGQTFIGVTDGPRPFRVSTLAGPPRLVVDIAH